MSSDSPDKGLKSEESVFSLEDLDKLIEAEDPGFNEQMNNIREAGQDIQADIQSLDLDGEGVAPPPVEEVEDKSLKGRILKKIRDPWNKLKEKFYLKIQSYKNRLRLLVGQAVDFFRHGLPERIKYYKTKSIQFLHDAKLKIKNYILQFKALSRKEKFGVFLVMLSTLVSVYLLGKVFISSELPQFVSPVVKTLEKEAHFVSSYKDKSELQNLFQAFPEPEYYVLLKKVIVNLRPDEKSRQNPMGIFEMYLGLDSQDTAIEVKDREREILDIAQRALEPFTYSEVISLTGRARMKAVVKEKINLSLNQGRASQVYFNTFITNP